MTIDIDEGHQGKMIAPLLLIPFVENSFKHGASKMISQPWVRLTIKLENNRLCLSLKTVGLQLMSRQHQRPACRSGREILV
jgi:LytS/YehU family sensor histidine kinase